MKVPCDVCMTFISDRQRKAVMARLSKIYVHTMSSPDLLTSDRTVRKWSDWRRRAKVLDKRSGKATSQRQLDQHFEEYLDLIDEVLGHREQFKGAVKWNYDHACAMGLDSSGRVSEIIWMRPEDFMKLVPMDNCFVDSGLDSLFDLHDRVMAGKKMDAGHLVYDSKTDTVIDHEGRHRTALFKIMGLKKIPVVLIGKSRLDRFRVGRTKRQEYDW